VGDADPRDVELPQPPIDLLLLLDVEMGGSLVQEEDLRILVERPGKQDTLLLPAGQRWR
jgi:hypothetical protein